MSEKRFTSNERWIAEGTIVDICDNGKVIMQVFDNDNIQNVFDLLNELNDENKELKKENKRLAKNLKVAKNNVDANFKSAQYWRQKFEAIPENIRMVWTE